MVLKHEIPQLHRGSARLASVFANGGMQESLRPLPLLFTAGTLDIPSGICLALF